MKSMFFLLVIVAVITASKAQYYELDNERDAAFNNYINNPMMGFRQKVERICPGHWEEYKSAAYENYKCSKSNYNTNETICTNLQHTFSRCSKPGMDMLNNCLPKGSQYIATFTLNILKSVSEYVCNAKAESVIELMNPCIRNITSRTQRCIRLVSTKLEVYQGRNKFPTEQELCDILTSLKSCVYSHVNDSCGHPTTRKTFIDLYEIVLKECPQVNVQYNLIK